jgi:hypothetical protein
MKTLIEKIFPILMVGLLSACAVSQAAPTSVPTSIPATPTESLPQIPGLSEDAVRTLASFQQVDAYPLYVMQYYGGYDSLLTSNLPPVDGTDSTPDWACSLFTTLLDGDHMLYGRNFDWSFSPALLLFTDPPNGYASVSMVNIDSPKYTREELLHATDFPLEERTDLLYTPFTPYDGMNEYGLAIGMAKVPSGNMKLNPSKKTIGPLMIMREILDHARNVDEALAIMDEYNVGDENGPGIHYLIADAEGKAVLVEFYMGKVYVIENEVPWHLATNTLIAPLKDPVGHDLRYDRIYERLTETQGMLDPATAMQLLSDVSQGITQWSIVYEMSNQQVDVVMGREYATVHTFLLSDYFDTK